jgi:hypothetical protein
MRPDAPITAGSPAATSVPKNHSFEVKNFTDADTLLVETWYPPEGHPCKAPLVGLIQRNGSMSFNHSITAGQARQMAEQLVQCADAIEGRQPDPLNGFTLCIDSSLEVECIETTEGETLRIAVPMFEAISLEQNFSDSAVLGHYIEIPLHHVPAVIAAMQKAAVFAAVDSPDRGGYVAERAGS